MYERLRRSSSALRWLVVSKAYHDVTHPVFLAGEDARAQIDGEIGDMLAARHPGVAVGRSSCPYLLNLTGGRSARCTIPVAGASMRIDVTGGDPHTPGLPRRARRARRDAATSSTGSRRISTLRVTARALLGSLLRYAGERRAGGREADLLRQRAGRSARARCRRSMHSRTETCSSRPSSPACETRLRVACSGTMPRRAAKARSISSGAAVERYLRSTVPATGSTTSSCGVGPDRSGALSRARSSRGEPARDHAPCASAGVRTRTTCGSTKAGDW